MGKDLCHWYTKRSTLPKSSIPGQRGARLFWPMAPKVCRLLQYPITTCFHLPIVALCLISNLLLSVVIPFPKQESKAAKGKRLLLKVYGFGFFSFLDCAIARTGKGKGKEMTTTQSPHFKFSTPSGWGDHMLTYYSMFVWRSYVCAS